MSISFSLYFSIGFPPPIPALPLPDAAAAAVCDAALADCEAATTSFDGLSSSSSSSSSLPALAAGLAARSLASSASYGFDTLRTFCFSELRLFAFDFDSFLTAALSASVRSTSASSSTRAL